MGACESKTEKDKKARGNMKRKKGSASTISEERSKCGDEKQLKMELEAVFRTYNKSNNGFLSRPEITAMLREMNSRQKTGKSEEMLHLMVDKMIGKAED
jgi:Ca2+-binding EF-hand superfamily protein